MDRRKFLSMLAVGSVGAAVIPTAELIDKIQWALSPSKTIFVPERPTLYRPSSWSSAWDTHGYIIRLTMSDDIPYVLQSVTEYQDADKRYTVSVDEALGSLR